MRWETQPEDFIWGIVSLYSRLSMTPKLKATYESLEWSFSTCNHQNGHRWNQLGINDSQCLSNSYESFIQAISGSNVSPSFDVLMDRLLHQLKYNSKFDKETLYLKPHRGGEPSYDNSRHKGLCNYYDDRVTGWKNIKIEKLISEYLKFDHKVKLDQRFKSSANIILEELTKILNPNDADVNAIFEVAIASLDKNFNPHWY